MFFYAVPRYCSWNLSSKMPTLGKVAEPKRVDVVTDLSTDLIAPIADPEHPLSLESLGVVKLRDVHLTSPPDLRDPAALSRVLVELTPTVSHCSLATIIGLGVRVRLEQALPPSYRVEVKIKEGTHSQAEEVSKQLADKERVAAALENENLMGMLKKMMKPCIET